MWGEGAHASTSFSPAPPVAPGAFPEVLGLVLWIGVSGQQAAPAESIVVRSPVCVTGTRAGVSQGRSLPGQSRAVPAPDWDDCTLTCMCDTGPAHTWISTWKCTWSEEPEPLPLPEGCLELLHGAEGTETGGSPPPPAAQDGSSDDHSSPPVCWFLLLSGLCGPELTCISPPRQSTLPDPQGRV